MQTVTRLEHFYRTQMQQKMEPDCQAVGYRIVTSLGLHLSYKSLLIRKLYNQTSSQGQTPIISLISKMNIIVLKRKLLLQNIKIPSITSFQHVIPGCTAEKDEEYERRWIKQEAIKFIFPSTYLREILKYCQALSAFGFIASART